MNINVDTIVCGINKRDATAMHRLHLRVRDLCEKASENRDFTSEDDARRLNTHR